MEYEGRQWTSLTEEEKDEALAFVPTVFDQDLGPIFISCVGRKAKALKDTFDLGKIWEGRRWAGGGGKM